LRESHTVVEMREKIKDHLLSHGMVKGHSGSGSRTVTQRPEPRPVKQPKPEEVPPILRLGSEESGSSSESSSGSPSTPTLCLPEENSRYSHALSSSRDEAWAAPPYPTSTSYDNYTNLTLPPMFEYVPPELSYRPHPGLIAAYDSTQQDDPCRSSDVMLSEELSDYLVLSPLSPSLEPTQEPYESSLYYILN